MSRGIFMNAKLPNKPDPAVELTARIWKAHVAYIERNRKTPSQAQLARDLSEMAGVPVDQTTVGTWFNEGTTPKPWFLQALAGFYGVSFVWLASGKGRMIESEDEPGEAAHKRKAAPVR